MPLPDVRLQRFLIEVIGFDQLAIIQIGLQRFERPFLCEVGVLPIVEHDDIRRRARGQIGIQARAKIAFVGDVNELDFGVGVRLFKGGDQRLIGFQFFRRAKGHERDVARLRGGAGAEQQQQGKD